MGNNNIEDGIIGCILVNPDCLFEVYDKITPEMFTSNFCKQVYETMLSFYDSGKKFDETILANKMATQRSDADVFKKQFADLIMATPTSVSITDYSKILIANYQSKRLNLLIKGVDSNPAIVNDTIATLITRLEEIQSNEKEKSHTLTEIIESNSGNYFDGNDKKEFDLKTGLDRLDECISFVGGDVTVIGARPSVGKSALATQIAKNVARQGKKVGYFNLEMIESQIYERLVASESEISLVRIRKAKNFLADEKEKFLKANEELKKLNIVVSTGSKSDLDIKAESRHQNFDLIIIDYLQLVRSHKKCESRRVEVGEVSRGIKSLAMELNVPVILLSQLSRKSEYTQDKEPSMADLRETGDIEQDASNIILMWNLRDEPDYKEFKGLKVDKNRQGELITEALDFLGEKMTFVETKESIEDIKRLLESNKSRNDDENPFI